MEDDFGRDAGTLKEKKLWLFDMDGTIYNENSLFDGVRELLSFIENSGGTYIFVTNNSSKSVSAYVEKLKRMGLEVGEEHFFTSAQATILWLQKNCPGAKVYCQGTRSLLEELREAGIDITEDPEKVDVVLVGFDEEMTSEKLRTTCEILTTQEVAFIATNPDLACPVSFGYVPDCGSICKMLENATGKKPAYMGKPEPVMVEAVCAKQGIDPEQTVLVGDRLYTDIATGVNAGITSICVLTGEASLEDIERSEVKPTFVFESVQSVERRLTETMKSE